MGKVIRLERRLDLGSVAPIAEIEPRDNILQFPTRGAPTLDLAPDWLLSSDFPLLSPEQVFHLGNDPELRVMLRALYRSGNLDGSYSTQYLGREVRRVLRINYTFDGLQKAIGSLINNDFADRYFPPLDLKRFNARRDERIKLKPHLYLGQSGAKELVSILEQYSRQDVIR